MTTKELIEKQSEKIINWCDVEAAELALGMVESWVICSGNVSILLLLTEEGH
jgi:hypothetical protein